MPRHTLHLACYDVTDDAERERLAGVLEGFGVRVQKSAFECRLTRSARGRLVTALEELKMQSGFVLLYEVGAQPKRHSVGVPPKTASSENEHAIVA